MVSMCTVRVKVPWPDISVFAHTVTAVLLVHVVALFGRSLQRCHQGVFPVMLVFDVVHVYDQQVVSVFPGQAIEADYVLVKVGPQQGGMVHVYQWVDQRASLLVVRQFYVTGGVALHVFQVVAKSGLFGWLDELLVVPFVGILR